MMRLNIYASTVVFCLIAAISAFGEINDPEQNPGQQPGQQPDQLPGFCVPILRIQKKGPAIAQVGDFGIYEITLENLADCQATDVDVVDVLPEGVNLVSVNPCASFLEQETAWVGQVLNAGETKSYMVMVKFIGPIGDSRLNKACAYHGFDPGVCNTITTNVVEVNSSSPQVLAHTLMGDVDFFDMARGNPCSP